MKKVLYIILCIIIVIRFCGFDVLLFHIQPPLIKASEAPYQRTFRFYHPDIAQRGQYDIKALATFSITGRVLGTKDYSAAETGDLIPLDIALGWKRMADPEVLKHFSISQSSRAYQWNYDASSPVLAREVDHTSVNNHLIPADNTVYEKLKTVVPGQIINLRGYLVEASTPDGWRWRSAMTGGDIMIGLGCKLIFVQSIDILN